MADEDYDEVDAVVRIPKGERLVDSKKSDGWSRGFTPKTTEKGPEHVEIRLKDDEDEPEVVYVTEYVEHGRPQLTPGQQFVADLMQQALDGLIEISKPIVINWFETQVVPAVAAKRDNITQKRQARKAQKQIAASAPASVVASEPPSGEVATAPTDPKVTVTAEQFQQLFTTWLAREDAQQALWDIIVNAEVEDGDAATLEWQRALMELSPEQRSARVLEFFSSNPSILEDFGRQILQRSSLETPSPEPGAVRE